MSSCTSVVFRVLVAFLPFIFATTAYASSPLPSYVTSLTEAEYSVFHSAVTAGVTGHDTWCEYQVRLAEDTAGDPLWTITFDNSKVLTVVEYWMAEQSARLIDAIDATQVGQPELIALDTVKSLNRKIKASIASPIWERSQLLGVVSVQASVSDGTESAVLTLDEPHEHAPGRVVKLVGDVGQYRAWDGAPVIVNGTMKREGAISEVTVRDRRLNTLELVIMSQCPYGTQAAERILPLLLAPADDPDADSPRVEIRYLFYPKAATDDTSSGWWCLHGEPELHENLVQMVLRDTYPELFAPYLQARLESPDAGWETLAGFVSLTAYEIERIASEIETDRDLLIESEHAYVSESLGVTDGSPTWVWESQQVSDTSQVKAIQDLSLSAGKCGGDH